MAIAIEVMNDGLLFGGTFAIDLSVAKGPVQVTNHATIDGDVVTGAGDDIVKNAGRIHGSISPGTARISSIPAKVLVGG